MTTNALQFSEKITCLPVIHGSGDFAIEARRLMLEDRFDCVAVPLPRSFQQPVEEAIGHLPTIGIVVQNEAPQWAPDQWTPESDRADDDDSEPAASFVPVDPCQPVIAALRIALQERMTRAFIDLETSRFEPRTSVMPDPYALKRVSASQFAAAVLPSLPRLPEGQPSERALHMASRLRELEANHDRILFLCALTDWPWIREAYTEQIPSTAEHDLVEPAERFTADPDTLLFLLGELPFVTSLYEQARSTLDDDENLSIDGIKELLLVARDRYQSEFRTRARSISPKSLGVYLKYVRNLALMERRLTPDLYSLVVAAQQIFGDQFAVQLAETTREYSVADSMDDPEFRMSVDRGRCLPDGEVMTLKNRLPGQSLSWRSCELRPSPPKPEKQQWEMNWNPFSHCSWPEEDVAIERFRTHIRDVALSLMGGDLARTEKFSTSMMDGLDMRETLRNWHTGDLYVKVLPPTVGKLDCVVMLFDSPADPRDYPWRITWHAEHQDESTLALFATDHRQEMIGPGIGLARYGGGLFLFPPRPVPDIWTDPRLDFTDTLEERMLAAACLHAEHPHIALLSPGPPGPAWRRLAKRFRKTFVHIPLSRFSQQTIEQLRMFHVLNGKDVRSYAAHFIRKA